MFHGLCQNQKNNLAAKSETLCRAGLSVIEPEAIEARHDDLKTFDFCDRTGTRWHRDGAR
jgi:hypothetical protein